MAEHVAVEQGALIEIGLGYGLEPLCIIPELDEDTILNNRVCPVGYNDVGYIHPIAFTMR